MDTAMQAAHHAPRSMLDTLSAEDFETASIRSAAPSYISEAPSYHSTAPPHSNLEPIPPYSPRAPGSTLSASRPSNSAGAAPATAARTSANHRPATLSSSEPTTTNTASSSSPANPNTPERRYGLPPVPTGPIRTHDQLPSLGAFRIPSSWSNLHHNPTARHYHNVAHRRSTAAAAAGSLDAIKRMGLLDRIEEDERRASGRPLEDPYLVGEEAASRARRERLARENGDEVLIREDRHWDWFLGELGLVQMKDWNERERSWKQFRREVESGSRGRLPRRLGSRFMM